MSGAAIEYIRGLSIVKSFGQEGASIENFRNASKELKDIHIKVERGYTPYNCLHLFVLKLASMGIVLVCAWQALQGQMSISVFLMFVLFLYLSVMFPYAIIQDIPQDIHVQYTWQNFKISCAFADHHAQNVSASFFISGFFMHLF